MKPSIDMARDSDQAYILILEALSSANRDGAQLPSLAKLSDEEDVENLYALAREMIAKDRFIEIEVSGEASFWALPRYFRTVADFELVLDTVEGWVGANDLDNWQTVARQFGETSDNLPERLYFFAKKLAATGRIEWPLAYD
jgi:hypothetical protein